jgi:hypothetical protein
MRFPELAASYIKYEYRRKPYSLAAFWDMNHRRQEFDSSQGLLYTLMPVFE